jgi:hypothetical protein
MICITSLLDKIITLLVYQRHISKWKSWMRLWKLHFYREWSKISGNESLIIFKWFMLFCFAKFHFEKQVVKWEKNDVFWENSHSFTHVIVLFYDLEWLSMCYADFLFFYLVRLKVGLIIQSSDFLFIYKWKESIATCVVFFVILFVLFI